MCGNLLLRSLKEQIGIQSSFCIPVALVISLHEFVDICEPYIDAIIIIAFNK